MKKYTAILATFSLLGAFSATVVAQEAAPAVEPVATSMHFATISPSAAYTGTAMAGTASVSSMAWSGFSNAAVMPFYKGKFDVQLAYQNWAPKSTKSMNLAGGVAYRAGKFGVSLGFARFGGAKYKVVDDLGVVRGEFAPSDMNINLGLAYGIGEHFSVGLNAKYLTSALTDKDSYSAFAGNVFFMGRYSDITFAVGASNIGTPVKNRTESFALPMSATAAVSYGKVFAEKHGIEASADFNYFFSGGLTAALGARYAYNDLVFVSAGYHLGTQKAPLPSFASVGLGVKYFGVRLEASYMLGGTLGNTITAGLGYSF